MSFLPNLSGATGNAPTASAAPTLSTSSPVAGNTITATAGTYTGAPTVTRQWYWGDTAPATALAGATGLTYTVLTSDVGHQLLYVETAKNNYGTDTAQANTGTVTAQTLTISGTPGSGTVGTFYYFAPTVAGGVQPYAFTLPGALPAGLTLNQKTGVIAGTPTVVTSSASFTLTVTDSKGTTTSLGSFSLGAVSGPAAMPAMRLEALNGVVNIYGNANSLNGGTFQNFKIYEGASGSETLLASPTTLPYQDTRANGTTVYYRMSVVTSNGEGLLCPEGSVSPSTTFSVTTDFTVTSQYASVLTALSSAGTTPSGPLQYVQNDLVKRLVTVGAWAQLTWFTDAYYAVNQAQALINWVTPSQSLTVVGSPTFTTKSGFTGGGSTSNYYQTSLTLASITQNSCHIALYSSTAGALAPIDVGAEDTSSNGLALTALNALNTVSIRASGAGVASSTAALRSDDTSETLAGYYNGGGHLLVNRTSSASADIYSRGRYIETVTSASVALTSTNKIALLTAGGATTASTRTIPFFHTGAGLTTAQAQTCGAAITDYFNMNQYGIPRAIDAGVGPAQIYAEVVVLGTTPAAICAAYQAKRRGRSVVIVGMEGESRLWRLGGMLAQGLGFADVGDVTLPAGIWRDMTKWINTVYYARTDTSTQAGYDIDARAWNLAFRRMLDPTQTGTLLPGFDIPVIWSGGGVTSVAKSGTVAKSVTMSDGRIINFQKLISADYIGQALPLASIPTITGREARSTNTASIEYYAGYQLPNAVPSVTLPSPLKAYLSPYVTAGVASSGLLPDIVNPSSLAVGAADPNLQAMNYRLQLTSTQIIRVPWPTTAPRNYNVQRYEMLMRLMAANGNYLSLTDSSVNFQNTIGNISLGDFNNGSTGLSTDLPQSGLNYGQAANASARATIVADLSDYTQGLFYKQVVNAEADSRNSTTLSTNLFKDCLCVNFFTNPESTGFLWWPDQAYIREPVFQMQNAGFVLNADDITATDGTTPKSTNTICAGSYDIDIHSGRHVAYDNSDGNGVVLYLQGQPPKPPLSMQAGGADQRFPIPLEAVVPDASVCTNLLTPTCPSMTKLAWAATRLEPTLSVMGQSCGMIAALSIEQSCSVQSVNYVAFQNAMASEVDTYKVPLPQVN